jgi:hypothetical protein
MPKAFRITLKSDRIVRGSFAIADPFLRNFEENIENYNFF